MRRERVEKISCSCSGRQGQLEPRHSHLVSEKAKKRYRHMEALFVHSAFLRGLDARTRNIRSSLPSAAPSDAAATPYPAPATAPAPTRLCVNP